MKVVYTTPKAFAGWPLSGLKGNLPTDAEYKMAVFDPDDSENEEFYREISDADAVMNVYVHLGKKELDAMKKCRVVSFMSTGYNEIDLDYATSKGIAVASVLDYCTQETAENAIANMMALQRGTIIYNEAIQEKHVWNVGVVKGLKRVEGQVIGIVGLGRIGRHVAMNTRQGVYVTYEPDTPSPAVDTASA